MKKSKFTEEQITFALKQAEIGTTVEEICRKMGICQATFYAWRKKFGGLGVAELRRFKAARRREPQAQATGRRSEPGQGHAAGRLVKKKALRPAQRKTLVGPADRPLPLRRAPSL